MRFPSSRPHQRAELGPSFECPCYWVGRFLENENCTLHLHSSVIYCAPCVHMDHGSLQAVRESCPCRT
uniref:Uncharacterized protein n=1 Tax=Steinernema glaseri TaxID=37863 RepID=A0A1I7YTM2_9BILA